MPDTTNQQPHPENPESLAAPQTLEALAVELKADGPSAFSKMASFAACSLLAQQALRDPAALGTEAFDAAAEAWKLMATPEGCVLMGLLHVPEENSKFFRPEHEVPQEDKLQYLIAPGYTEAQIIALSKATRAIAKLIDETAATPSFSEAARSYASMLAKVNADSTLGFPLLGIALRKSTTKLDGKMTPTISAASMQTHTTWNPDSKPKDSASAAERASELYLRELNRIEGSEALAPSYYMPSEISNALYRAGGGVHSGSTVAKIEDDLPSVESLQRWFQALGMTKSDGAMQPQADDFSKHLTSAWPDSADIRLSRAAAALAAKSDEVLAFALNSDKQRGLSVREWNKSISSGPLSQAFETKQPIAKLSIGASMLFTLRIREAMANLGHMQQPANTADYQTHLSAQAFAELSSQPSKIAKLLSKAAGLSKASLAKKHMTRHMMGSFHFPKDTREFIDSRQVDKNDEPRFGSETGMSGLAGRLSKASPALGVAQWADSAMSALGRDAHSIERISVDLIADPARQELVRALREFDASRVRARALFVQSAVAAAWTTQKQWLDSLGFLPAWTQAGLIGKHTPRSVGWAAQNPNESAASDDPMERMAAACARGLGLGKLAADQASPQATLAERMRLEFNQAGLGQAGWDLLARSQPIRDYAMGFLGNFTAKDKNDASTAKTRWPMACKAIEAAGRAGLDDKNAKLFCEGIAPFRHARYYGYADSALTEGFQDIHLAGPEQAQMAIDLATAKRKNLQSAYDALARDWRDCLAEGARLGVDAQAAIEAQRRGALLATRAHAATEIDWRLDPFSSHEAWQVFELPSHRIAAILERAKIGSPLEKWSAAVASSLDIQDAPDVNGLVGQAKEACKSRWGMSDGTWKLAIKSPATLDALSEAIIHASRGIGDNRTLADSAKLTAADRQALQGTGQYETDDKLRFYAAGLASAQGAAPEALGDILAIFRERRDTASLFSRAIPARSVQDADAAVFYKAESDAKSSRMPKIFQEMCKRRQKLDADYQKAKSEGRDGVLSAKESLSGEIADLCDWLGRSEMGIWQNLPQEPTWGQLRRLSSQWHEEQHAIELDRQARAKAKFAEEREAHKLNPFAPRATEHWEPILGLHKRDGWEAVELTSQSQLTDEGQAMHHCVSSYSSYCREGNLRIFSIRLDGERKCTMEIRSDKDLRHLDENAVFRITQNKGKHNAEVVSPATRAFCEETIAAATIAWRVKHAETQELRRLDEEKKEAARQAAAAARKAQADAEKAAAASSTEPASPSLAEEACASIPTIPKTPVNR